MSGFKLIAIIPLKGCSTDYRKNLEEGKPYQFYNNYEITMNDTGNQVISVKKGTNKIPDNLYQLKNGINLNFSAVVGKNGTGKSAIFELLYYFVYLLCITKKEKGKPILVSVVEQLRTDEAIAQKEYDSLKELISEKNPTDADEVNCFKEAFHIYRKYNLSLDRQEDFGSIQQFCDNVRKEFDRYKMKYIRNTLPNIDSNEIGKEDKFTKDFSLSIIYELSEFHGYSNSVKPENTIYNLTYRNSDFSLTSYDLNGNVRSEELGTDTIDLESFFYSISLNYSHHSVNSLSLGNWINRLFHKNDAYITPVVINPMRNEGNFDINHELKLSKERLMANLLYDIIKDDKKEFKLLDKYKIKGFVFSPKDSLREYQFRDDQMNGRKPFSLFFDIDDLENLPSLFIVKKAIKGLWDINNDLAADLDLEELKNLILDRDTYWGYAIAYLERKLKRISENYADIIYKPNNGSRRQQLEEFIRNDNTHITKKIRQTLKYLQITYKNAEQLYYFKDKRIHENNLKVRLPTKEMLDWLKFDNKNIKELIPSGLIEIGLPGFFNVDFVFENIERKNVDISNGFKKKDEDYEVEFARLSSGEQQMILNINTLLYHLYNLNSVHKTSDEDRLKYDNVNIILDEVELYYHPEMQRKLVSELCRNFERIKTENDKGIKGINVCLLTHSPFILSDIPIQNVLVLKAEEDKENHSEEYQSFGANINEMLLSKFYMDNTIGEHVKGLINDILEFYGSVLLANEEDLEKLKKKFMELKKEKFEFVVANIGDDLIRNILKNHLDFIKEKFKTV